jgi:transposase-like protein
LLVVFLSIKSTLFFLGENWFGPLEERVRDRIRGFIEELLEADFDAVLAPKRYQSPTAVGSSTPVKASPAAGHRHGHRELQLLGKFGPANIRVPRTHLITLDGIIAEWKKVSRLSKVHNKG